MQHKAKVNHLVEPEYGAKALTKHIDTIRNAFLYCRFAFLLAINVVKGAVGGGHTFHPTQPHTKFSIVRNDFNI